MSDASGHGVGGGGIVISNRELYDMMQGLRDQVKEVQLQTTSLVNTNADLSKRIRALELRFYGILAGLVGAASYLAFAVHGVKV